MGSEISHLCKGEGRLDDAMQTMGSTKPDYILKKEFMRAFLKAGQKNGAEQIASDDPVLLGFLAAIESTNGDPRFKDTFAQAIRKAVEKQKNGIVTRTLNLINAVSSNMRPFAYRDALNILITAEDFENSDRILGEMDEAWLLDIFTLQRLIREQTKSGHYKRAVDRARRLDNPLLQANALLSVADGMLDLMDVPKIPGWEQLAHCTIKKD